MLSPFDFWFLPDLPATVYSSTIAIMPIGIRPINDFAFKKTFGSPENELALISLLNAILDLPIPIVDVRVENPYRTT